MHVTGWVAPPSRGLAWSILVSSFLKSFFSPRPVTRYANTIAGANSSSPHPENALKRKSEVSLFPFGEIALPLPDEFRQRQAERRADHPELHDVEPQFAALDLAHV